MTDADDRAEIRAAIEAHDKLVAGLRARAALAGFELTITSAPGGGSMFLVSRWGRTHELADVDAVERFLQQVGAP